jgi:hypothetical protein
MSPAQYKVLHTLFTSGFKPLVWGSDDTGWRVGPIFRVPARTKKSIERHGWIQMERSRSSNGVTIEWLPVTKAGRLAYIAAGGNPRTSGPRKPGRRHLG